MTNLLILVLQVTLLALLTGCQNSPTVIESDQPRDSVSIESSLGSEIATFEHLGALIDLCKSAHRMEVFEGLPHPLGEPELLEAELSRTDIMPNNDFWFYSPEVTLEKSERSHFRSEVASPSSYRRWSGPSYCGGFHPDLLARFHSNEGIVDVQLCFGCGEAKIYGPQSVRSHVSIQDGYGSEMEIAATANPNDAAV